MLTHTEDKYLKDLFRQLGGKEGEKERVEEEEENCFNLHFSDYTWGSALSVCLPFLFLQ